MDPSADLPKPSFPDNTSSGEQVRPQEKTVDSVKEELRRFIEGEQLGSVKSKAFCDFVDLRSLTPEFLGKDPIGETIRQRINEIPGYLGVREQASMLSRKLHARFKEDILREGQYTDPGTVTGMADYRVNDALNEVKLEYLRSQQDLKPPSESIVPPPQPATSV